MTILDNFRKRAAVCWSMAARNQRLCSQHYEKARKAATVFALNPNTETKSHAVRMQRQALDTYALIRLHLDEATALDYAVRDLEIYRGII